MAGVPDHLGSNGTRCRVRTTTREEPRLGLQSAPVLAQGFQQDGTEHDVPILTALAALDVDDHPSTIDVANLQSCQFVAACSGIVPDHRIVGHDNTFIQNRPADSGALADVTVIKNDRVLNKCAVVHAHASAQYRIADQSA